jgi:ElaB/YqjD/DUF883 family membrane-anchored ribosome-binding protein
MSPKFKSFAEKRRYEWLMAQREKNMTKQGTSDVAMLVIAKAVKDKVADKAREGVSPAEYNVDLTLRIQGTIRKAEDYTKDIPHKIRWDLLVAVLASKVNDETLASVLRDYAKVGDDEGKALTSQVKGKVEATIAELKGTTRQVVNGPITTDLAVEVLAEKVESSPLK